MNPLAKFVYKSALYTSLITLAFFLFASIMSVTELHLTFGRYFLIFAFGFILSASENVFTIEKISKPLKYVIHYLSLAIAFAVIFLSIRSTDETYSFGIDTIVASFVVFTFLYALGFGMAKLSKKLFYAQNKNNSQKSKEPKSEYESRFG